MHNGRYLLVGSSGYFHTYTGTGVHIGLKVLASTEDKTCIDEMVKDFYNKCGGLIMIIDTETKEEYIGEEK